MYLELNQNELKLSDSECQDIFIINIAKLECGVLSQTKMKHMVVNNYINCYDITTYMTSLIYMYICIYIYIYLLLNYIVIGYELYFIL